MSSPRLNSLINIYGWCVFFIGMLFFFSDCQPPHKFIEQKIEKELKKRFENEKRHTKQKWNKQVGVPT